MVKPRFGAHTIENLSPIGVDGRLGPPRAVVADRTARPEGFTGPLYLRRSPGNLDPGRLAADLSAGAEGILAAGLTRLPRDLERLGARLRVAEALSGLVEGSTRIILLVDGAPLAASLVGDLAGGRLRALGLDTAAVAATLGLPPSAAGGAALVHVKGRLVLTAAAAGVPAFVRASSRPGPDEVAALRSDGFELVLHPADDVARPGELHGVVHAPTATRS